MPSDISATWPDSSWNIEVIGTIGTGELSIATIRGCSRRPALASVSSDVSKRGATLRSVSTWLQRIADRLAKGRESDGDSQISEHFYKRSLYATTAEFLGALLALFPEGKTLSDDELHILVTELRGLWGPEKALEEGDLSEHVDFWHKLADHTSSPYALACYADTLLLAGRESAAIAVFTKVLELDPELLEELGQEIAACAQRLGGRDWLHFRLASLRVSIHGLADRDSDAIREVYSELLEEFSGDTDAMEEIRRLGESLEAAVERGEMPRAMVIRGRSRTSN